MLQPASLSQLLVQAKRLRRQAGLDPAELAEAMAKLKSEIHSIFDCSCDDSGVSRSPLVTSRPLRGALAARRSERHSIRGAHSVSGIATGGVTTPRTATPFAAHSAVTPAPAAPAAPTTPAAPAAPAAAVALPPGFITPTRPITQPSTNAPARPNLRRRAALSL
jgi:hypothetical protein